jgi:hypothetical protein
MFRRNLVGWIFWLAVVVSTAGCLLIWGVMNQQLAEELQPRAIPSPYPASTLVSDQVVTKEDGLHKRVLVYKSAAPLEMVRAYYEHHMQAAGWSFYGYPYTDSPASAYFQYWPMDGPVYKTTVKTEAAPQSPTLITIKMDAGGSDWHGP